MEKVTPNAIRVKPKAAAQAHKERIQQSIMDIFFCLYIYLS